MRQPTPLLPVAILAAALLACADDGATGPIPAADERSGSEIGATYVLRRVDGGLLPARAYASDEGFTEFLADTIRFQPDGRVHERRAVRSVITTPGYSRDERFDDVWTRRYARTGSRVRITPGGICDEGNALVLCIPPDSGSFRGDSLVLALEMPGAPRRAYVRVVE